MSQTIEIEEIKTINLKPGDVLAVKLPSDTSRSVLEAFRKNIREVFKNNKVMIFSGNVEFEKVRQDDSTSDTEVSS